MGTLRGAVFILVCCIGYGHGQFSTGTGQLGSGFQPRFRTIGGSQTLLTRGGGSFVQPRTSRGFTDNNNNNNNNNGFVSQIAHRPPPRPRQRRVQIVRNPVQSVQPQIVQPAARAPQPVQQVAPAPAAPVAAAAPAPVQQQTFTNPMAMNPMAMNPMAMNPMAMNPMMGGHMGMMAGHMGMMGGPMGMMGGAMGGMPMMSYDTMEDLFLDPDRPDPRPPMGPVVPVGAAARPAVAAAGAVAAVAPVAPARGAVAPAQTAVAAGTAAATTGAKTVNPSAIASALQTALSRVQQKHGQATVG